MTLGTLKKVTCVYLVGPITPTSRRNHSIEHLANIGAGIDAGIELMKAGFSVFNPFLDFLYCIRDGKDQFFTISMIRKLSLEFIPKCDAMFLLPGWKKSVGARGEIESAKKAGIPFFESIDELIAYAEKWVELKE